MSVLIKDMEMPETCKLCYLSEFNPGFYAYVCKPTGIRIDYDIAKIDRQRTICPLVLIPPHGRLIDADVMRTKMKCNDDWRKPLVEWVDAQETIIEAKE